MYDTLKMLHGYWAYLVLAVLVFAVIKAITGLINKSEYKASHFRVNLFTLITSHIQLLLGIILYFVSPRFQLWSELGSQVMSNSAARLYLVEHPIINLLAIALITIGYSKHKKRLTSPSKFKIITIFYGIGLLLFLSRIPWDVWPN